MFNSVKRTVSNFFSSKRKLTNGEIQETQAVTLTPVTRKKLLQENIRRPYVTELIDTYYGFGKPYLEDLIRKTISSKNIQQQMLLIARSLPLLKFFINSVSRVYNSQPSRKFFIDGKEIIKTPSKLNKENKTKPKQDSQEDSQENEPFNQMLNQDKFYYDDKLYETLNNFYSDDVIIAIKQAEKLTNLLNTTVHKVITNEKGEIRLIFLPSDSVQVQPDYSDLTKASQIAFVQDVIQEGSGMQKIITVIENWSKDSKTIPYNAVEKENPDEDIGINQAALEFEKLFGTKECGKGFAPFVVFSDGPKGSDFWDIKDKDVSDYIKSLNMEITELRYLVKFTSFGLKYTVNIKLPTDGSLDPSGVWQLAVENNAVPGSDTGKNWDIGEFKNDGKIDEVIRGIIFNMKMLFSMYNIPLDALISTNSVRSAENKQMDNEELFATINAQRDIWNLNEQNLFKIMQAVWNRDNEYKIPKGIELLVNYEEKKSKEKVAEDWIVEIQNNISTALDWLSSNNPDLDRDEVMNLLKSNKNINDEQKEEPLNLNAFASVDEEGNMIMPKLSEEDDKKNIEKEQIDSNLN